LNDQPYQHINMDEFQHFGYDVCHRHQGLMWWVILLFYVHSIYVQLLSGLGGLVFEGNPQRNSGWWWVVIYPSCFPEVHFSMIQCMSWSFKCPFLLGFHLECMSVTSILIVMGFPKLSTATQKLEVCSWSWIEQCTHY
jgi:hypothetical protein